ncbi:hypothetical protein DIPPA_22876 [Diplonema papillatum]|nr:hypothetical protein DIPPA_22876 [Diplonema papillatum]
MASRMDEEEELILLALLKAGEKRSTGKRCGRRGHGVQAHTAGGYSAGGYGSQHQSPLSAWSGGGGGGRSREPAANSLYEAAGLAVGRTPPKVSAAPGGKHPRTPSNRRPGASPASSKQGTGATPTPVSTRAEPPSQSPRVDRAGGSPVKEEAPASCPGTRASLRSSAAEEIDRSDLLEVESVSTQSLPGGEPPAKDGADDPACAPPPVPRESFSKSVERLLAAVQLPETVLEPVAAEALEPPQAGGGDGAAAAAKRGVARVLSFSPPGPPRGPLAAGVRASAQPPAAGRGPSPQAQTTERAETGAAAGKQRQRPTADGAASLWQGTPEQPSVGAGAPRGEERAAGGVEGGPESQVDPAAPCGNERAAGDAPTDAEFSLWEQTPKQKPVGAGASHGAERTRDDAADSKPPLWGRTPKQPPPVDALAASYGSEHATGNAATTGGKASLWERTPEQQPVDALAASYGNEHSRGCAATDSKASLWEQTPRQRPADAAASRGSEHVKGYAHAATDSKPSLREQTPKQRPADAVAASRGSEDIRGYAYAATDSKPSLWEQTPKQRPADAVAASRGSEHSRGHAYPVTDSKPSHWAHAAAVSHSDEHATTRAVPPPSVDAWRRAPSDTPATRAGQTDAAQAPGSFDRTAELAENLEGIPSAGGEPAAPSIPRGEVAARLLRLVEAGTLDKDDELRSLRRQLGRAFTLESSGDGCFISMVAAAEDAHHATPATGTRGKDAGPSTGGDTPSSRGSDGRRAEPEPGAARFFGDEALSLVVNVCDGYLCRLISQRAAGGAQHEALRVALAATEGLLAGLQRELKAVVPPAEARGPAPPRGRLAAGPGHGDSKGPDFEDAVETLRKVQVIGGDFGAAVASFLRQVDSAASGSEDPSTWDVVKEVARVVSGSVEAAEEVLTGAGTRSTERAERLEAGLVGKLDDLRAEEERLKASGKLEASTKLRVRVLDEQAAWLKEARDEIVGDAGCAEIVGRVSEKMSKSSSSVESAVERYERLARDTAERVHRCQAQVMNQLGSQANTEVADRDEAAVDAEILAGNTRRLLQVEEELQALQAELQSLFQARADLVKKRVVRAAELAKRRACDERDLLEAKTCLASNEESKRCLDELAPLVSSAQDVTSCLVAVRGNWEREVQSACEHRKEELLQALRRVWEQYQLDHEVWSSILTRSVAAMEDREVLLTGLIRDAEERYDEADRNAQVEQLDAVRTRRSELTRRLRHHRGEFMETYRAVASFVGAHPRAAASPRAGSSVPPASRDSHTGARSASPRGTHPPRASASPPPSARETSPEEVSPGYQTPPVRVLVRAPLESAVAPPSPALLESLKLTPLDAALAASGPTSSLTPSNIEFLRTATDLSTVADLYRIHSVPAVWRSFLSEKPLLKAELLMILHSYTRTVPVEGGAV